MSLSVFGVRHHGPGCARSLKRALEELQPDVIALEAPADVQPALELAGHDEMQPPVALLVTQKDEPGRSLVFPLAEFSPEWQTLRWASEAGVPVQAMDLPITHRPGSLVGLIEMKAKPAEAALPDRNTSEADEVSPDEEESQELSDEDAADANGLAPRWRTDPISLLAEAAGYDDHELWWEEQIERRDDARDLFAAILHAMQAVREELPEAREYDLRREAHMRQTIRKLTREGFERIAVVCGAWHAPVLGEDAIAGKRDGLKVKDDTALLKGLDRCKTEVTWIPWSFSRLTYRSGYGAGVHSPGWYDHIWRSPSEAPQRWIITAARLLREKDLDASAADAIEAARLADVLAALRDRRSPGLQELNEAIQTVFCGGESAPLRLIRNHLEVGDRIGNVPAEIPTVPLTQDLRRLQKSLRMKPSTAIKQLDLDLRQDMARERSRLLRRLDILGIPWGQLTGETSDHSTFRETWQLEWQPESELTLIEASGWGNTVENAALARLAHRAGETSQLAELSELLQAALLADLNNVFDLLLGRIQSTAAVATDVLHLMQSMLPLAKLLRYGDVRQTPLKPLEPVLSGVFTRAVVGLPAAVTGLDQEGTEQMLAGMQGTQESLQLLLRSDLQDEWNHRLASLLRGAAPGLIRGWCCRTLLEQGLLDGEELDRLTRQALSPVVDPLTAASWLNGLTRGSGLLLMHQTIIWRVMDRWLDELTEESFRSTLPQLRRAFSEFPKAARRQMGALVKRLRENNGMAAASGNAARTPAEGGREINHERAAKVLPVLAQILGVNRKAED